MTTMAGVTIAFSTGTMIRSFVGDIVMPALYAFINFSLKRRVGENTAFASISAFGVDKFIKEFITWVLVIVLTYVFIVFIMKRYVGTVKPADAKEKQMQPNTANANANASAASGAEEFYQQRFEHYYNY